MNNFPVIKQESLMMKHFFLMEQNGVLSGRLKKKQIQIIFLNLKFYIVKK